MKIEIEWLEDKKECETCGTTYATGAIVKKDDEIFLEMSPVAACYDGHDYTREQIYEMIIMKLGYELVQINEYEYE